MMTVARPRKSSRFEYEDQKAMLTWALEKMQAIDTGFQFRDDAKAIGHVRGEEFAGVVVFDTFSPNDCLVHLVSDGSRRWMTHDFATVAMAYPFHQCGFSRITCMISERNEASLRYTLKFGWSLEGYLRSAGSQGEGLLIFGMLRSECRWLRDHSEFFTQGKNSAIDGLTRAQDVLSRLRSTSHGQRRRISAVA